MCSMLISRHEWYTGSLTCVRKIHLSLVNEYMYPDRDLSNRSEIVKSIAKNVVKRI